MTETMNLFGDAPAINRNIDVYAMSLNNDVRFVSVNNTLKLPIEQNEVELLATLYGSYKGSDVWDEGAVRIESLSESRINLSKISFYELLVTNIIRNDYNNFRNFLVSIGNVDMIEALDKLKSIYLGLDFSGIVDLVEHCPLSNAVAVSVMLYDINGDLLIVERGTDVAIGQRLQSVSVTGSMNWNDFSQPNPVVACAIRECREELGVEVSEADVRLTGIAAGVRKLQPAFLLTATVRSTVKSVQAVRPACSEIAKVLGVSDIYAANEDRLTEIAKYQLSSDPRIVM